MATLDFDNVATLKYNGRPVRELKKDGRVFWPKPKGFLCFTAEQAGSTIKYINNGGNLPDVKWSTDGRNWNNWANNNPIPLTNVGDKVYAKGNNPSGFSSAESKYTSFNATGKIIVSGNVNSLLDNENGSSITEIPCDYCYNNLFRGSITSAENLELSITTLRHFCYRGMFQGCNLLTKTPLLPATIIKDASYENMFHSCTSLTTAPELPATTLGVWCYRNMFANCTSLTTAPELPATTLNGACYAYMFDNCTSLTTAPELPATNLQIYCYQHMFSYCVSLTTAPELPATTLYDYCYIGMFRFCKNLTNAPSELPATTMKTQCYSWMFEECYKLQRPPKIRATSLSSRCMEKMFYNDTIMKISTSGDADKWFFKCPSGAGYGNVGWMFTNCASYPSGTPTSGTNYYWYT